MNRIVNYDKIFFLFQERDFDKHVAYCRDEPAAQEFLQTNDEVREYFEASYILIFNYYINAEIYFLLMDKNIIDLVN